MIKMSHWPVRIYNNPNIELGLERIKKLLDSLGNPEKKLPPVVHVAGTNGKGSTVAFLKSIMKEAGYKVHTYTSPHLVYFNERINLNGEDISDSLLYEVIEECRIMSEKLNIQPTFFEGTTAAAFLAFSRVPADLLILETGLGGRLDATNVVENPLLTILTSISLDHTEFLGNHISQIAYEKAGIMKTNSPCVVSHQYNDALAVIAKKAEDIGAPLIIYEYDWVIEKLNNGFNYKSPLKELTITDISLKGEHQYINSSNSITAALNLKGFTVSDEAIINGIKNAYWPARLQQLKKGIFVNKLPTNWELYVDGAHNEGGAHILSLWMDEITKPIYVIAGVTKGRNSNNFFKYFKGKVELIVGVLVEAEPSSYSAEYIANSASQVGIKSTKADSLEEAIDLIISINKDPGVILVCGSLFLAGDLMFQNQGKR